jgi:YfiH family protein
VTTAHWRIDEARGVRFVRCEAIESLAGVAHGFSTRVAFGRADFDLGFAGRSEGEADSRRATFFSAAGLGDARATRLRQVHGGVIVEASHGSGPPAADGVIRILREETSAPVPAVCTADCVAILMVDRGAAVVAALHAGWRGVAAGIGATAVERFAAHGLRAAELVVALGPAILGCCYEVGDDVVSALDGVCGDAGGYVTRGAAGRTVVDLHQAIRGQLVGAGIPRTSIHASPWCTRCHNDQFFSFRVEGPAAGRMMAAIGPRAGP